MPSRFDQPTDDQRDAFSVGTHCTTEGCSGYVIFPAFDVFCSRCKIAHRDMLAKQDRLRAPRAKEMWKRGL